MSSAKMGDTVKVHYTGTLDDGTVFDSSKDGSPLEFTIGKGQILKGFEQGVIDLAVGKSTNVHIPAAEGYGLRREELVTKVPMEQLPEDLKPEIGMKLQAQTSDGHPMIITVTEIGDNEITIDGNHELADNNLNFDIELVEIVS